VESDRRAAALVRDNAAALGLAADVACAPVARYLAGVPSAPYDVVFLDPPYSETARVIPGDLAALVRGGWLAADAAVVVERSSRDVPTDWPVGLEADRRRSYGETALDVARWAKAV
jgi:16S rRNA (guanine966-N2)-methyltransferase